MGNAVTQMDQGTQQNVALVEEANAATQSLQQQANQLADVVAGFKLPSERESVLQMPQIQPIRQQNLLTLS